MCSRHRLVLAVSISMALGSAAAVATTDARAAARVAVLGAPGSPPGESLSVDVATKIASTGLHGEIETFPIGTGHEVPSLETLAQHDAVLVYSDDRFADAEALGDVLADYVDGGGGVVVGTFAFIDDPDFGLRGRFLAGYLPFTVGSFQAPGTATLVRDVETHPILSNVRQFDGGLDSFQNAPLDVTPGSTLVAHWSGGQPLVATRVVGAGRVVGLNFFPPSSDAKFGLWRASTDGEWLLANALEWASCQPGSSDGACRDGEPVGTGGAGGAGAQGAGGATPPPGGGGGSEGTATPGDGVDGGTGEDGCSCRLPGGAAGSTPATLFALAAVLAARARVRSWSSDRRRRSDR